MYFYQLLALLSETQNSLLGPLYTFLNIELLLGMIRTFLEEVSFKYFCKSDMLNRAHAQVHESVDDSSSVSLGPLIEELM